MPKKKKYDARFPPARIKKIMQADEEVGKISAAIPVMISRILEKFIADVLTRASKVSESWKTRTIGASHLGSAMLSDPRLAFLAETVKQHVKDGPDIQTLASTEIGTTPTPSTVPDPLDISTTSENNVPSNTEASTPTTHCSIPQTPPSASISFPQTSPMAFGIQPGTVFTSPILFPNQSFPNSPTFFPPNFQTPNIIFGVSSPSVIAGPSAMPGHSGIPTLTLPLGHSSIPNLTLPLLNPGQFSPSVITRQVSLPQGTVISPVVGADSANEKGQAPGSPSRRPSSGAVNSDLRAAPYPTSAPKGGGAPAPTAPRKRGRPPKIKAIPSHTNNWPAPNPSPYASLPGLQNLTTSVITKSPQMPGVIVNIPGFNTSSSGFSFAVGNPAVPIQVSLNNTPSVSKSCDSPLIYKNSTSMQNVSDSQCLPSISSLSPMAIDLSLSSNSNTSLDKSKAVLKSPDAASKPVSCPQAESMPGITISYGGVIRSNISSNSSPSDPHVPVIRPNPSSIQSRLECGNGVIASVDKVSSGQGLNLTSGVPASIGNFNISIGDSERTSDKSADSSNIIGSNSSVISVNSVPTKPNVNNGFAKTPYVLSESWNNPSFQGAADNSDEDYD